MTIYSRYMLLFYCRSYKLAQTFSYYCSVFRTTLKIILGGSGWIISCSKQQKIQKMEILKMNSQTSPRNLPLVANLLTPSGIFIQSAPTPSRAGPRSRVPGRPTTARASTTSSLTALLWRRPLLAWTLCQRWRDLIIVLYGHSSAVPSSLVSSARPCAHATCQSSPADSRNFHAS